jgi:hypothetical protein
MCVSRCFTAGSVGLMGAVPTGLGSIFLGLPHGLRRGLYHVAPSGLGCGGFGCVFSLKFFSCGTREVWFSGGGGGGGG